MYYPQLNENPNVMIDPEYWKSISNPNIYAEQRNRVTFRNTNNITFSYYDGKLAAQDNMSTEEGYSHWDLARDFRSADEHSMGVGRGKYGGRLFLEYKVVSFWEFPETHKALYDILSDLENKMDIQILEDPEWTIEVPTRNTKWEERQHHLGDVDFIPIKDYKGGHIRTRAEMEAPHKKPDPRYGGGSNKQKTWKEWEKPFESFYPQIS